ncbi:outer membrane protein [Mesorhizobium mediterraneum]|uniref:outer membrane protein n=1 Tax=Mesorhizobium mediterraneum TaxID=43617 RepID=UPI001781BEAD|nr:outer membrane protein [Mesorhizobium mediterraneum]
MKTILLATAFILAPVGMASAADINEVLPVDAAYSWSGLYAGVHVGYAAGNSDFFIANPGVTRPLDPDGFIGGVHIGFNQEMANRFVLGAEADIAYNDVDGLTSFSSGLIRSEIKWSGSARLRAGYTFDRTLPYVTAGVAAAKYEATLITGTPQGNILIHDETHIGWTVGAGVEHAFTDKWLARVEYRFSDFGSQDLSLADGVNTIADVDLQTHDIRVGLSYKF